MFLHLSFLGVEYSQRSKAKKRPPTEVIGTDMNI